MRAPATYPDEPEPEPSQRRMVWIPEQPTTWSSLSWDPYTVVVVEVTPSWRPDGYLGWIR